MRRSFISLALTLLAGCGSSSTAASGSDGGNGTTTPDASVATRDGGHGRDSGSSKDSGTRDAKGTGPTTPADARDPDAKSTTDAASDVKTPPVVGASVVQFHNHLNRDGLFVDPKITRASAASFALDPTFTGTVTGNVYASPLYVEQGVGGKGTFYVATEAGTVFALDETTGAVVWQKNVGPSPTSTGAGCGNISPIGITGTPAIDLTTRLIVFDSALADGNDAIATHMIYALSIDDGTVAWQVDASTITSPDGITFSPQPQNQRAAVLILNGIAYVAYGGHYGDCATYHGWVIGVPLSGQGAKGWASMATGAGIWGPGGPSSDGESLYVTTGNATDSNATWAESEGLLRLDPGPTFTRATADYFSPYNWQNLDSDDLDLSGSGPLLVDAPALTPSALALAQGKDGYLYLLDRQNLGGIATASTLANVGALKVMNGEITNGGAWATVSGTTYVVVRPNGGEGSGCPNGTSGDLVAVKLDPSAPQKMSVAWCADSHGSGSPSITTSDGTNDPLVWILGADPGQSGLLTAFDLTTGALVTTNQTGSAAVDVRRFTTPIAVHGRIFVGGDNQLFRLQVELNVDAPTKATLGLWVALPLMGVDYLRAWSRLPARMVVHFDAAGHPNGFTSREGALGLALVSLGGLLGLFTLGAYVVRTQKPGSVVPVLTIFYLVIGLVFVANGLIVSINLGD